ncbi:tripartite tricarboxylate transporter substrate-binding protein [Chelativorans sp. AA-79]|uniref:Bug family tripartite tricarboxylate transporter substrate binding protein n=1 Tax=Chelativorans sp. AA-79 TaxID=3028735 RepID=UPI0023FA2C94|nr:tripartite tricarboxylate transporter substrate-binding protein [Chelativorans sp. AA-79]WEX09033.1 tripartite tricarboxylate transporter substrate-binding protein [Chelativorans sp. AA-79]
MNRRDFITTAVTAGVLAMFAGAGSAQDFPSRPVTVVVPYTAGGATDTLARVIAAPLSEALGQPVVIENRPGAGGAVGAEFVARSGPDGYTLLFHTATVSVYPTTQPDLDFDYRTDFAPITLAARAPYVIAISNNLPANDLKGFIEYAKAHPGELNHGSPGTGTSTHLAAELFKQQVGIDLLHVPYGGSSAVLTATRAGEIDFMMDTYLGLKGAVDGGDVKPLAVGTANRQAFNKDIPTFKEQDVEDLELAAWFAFAAPAGTPEDIIGTLNAAILEALKNPRVVATVEAQGEIVGSTPQELGAQVAKEVDMWAQVAAKAGVE